MVLEDFPAVNGPEREAKIIECVRSGRAEYNFVKIKTTLNGHTAEFLVFEDALKVDGVRVNVTAVTQQQIADLLRCVLPTAKLYDLMWHLTENRIDPYPQPITSTTEAMIGHSKKIDLALGNTKGLKSTVGKIWIIDNSLATKPGMACNYGWHFSMGSSFKGISGNINASMMKNPKTNQYWYMIQSRGWHHTPSHVDYSQVCVLVSRQCWIDGKERDILDVFCNSELAPLCVHDGVLKVHRQPNVPELKPIVDLPVNTIPELTPIPESSDSISEPPKQSELIKPMEKPEAPTPDSHQTNQNLPVIVETPKTGSIWTLIMSIISMFLKLFGKR